MKRLFLAATIALLSIGYAVAQKSIVVDSEKVFRSIADYNTALATLDKESKDYQAAVDAKFANIEKLYNTYTQQKAQLPQSERTRREQEILALERSATTYQESIFGTWSRCIWDVTAVAWLLNDNDRFMRSYITATPIPEYDHRYSIDPTRHPERYVYSINRDALFTDLFTKLAGK